MDLNVAILLGTLVLLAGVAAVRISARAGLPSLLIYLAFGLVLGEGGLGFEFEDVDLTMLLGTLALAVILAGFGTVLWLSGGSSRQVSQIVRIVFSGSVGGLSRGSSVNFNGIKVGEVTDIRLAPQDPRRVLAQIKVALGDLDKVQRVVRLGGFINATPDFLETPKVMNGASDLMVTAFGDRGRHARTTIGVAVLPLDAAVEVDGIFEVS